MAAGFNELIESLSQRFPNEKKGLTKYLKTVRQVSDERTRERRSESARTDQRERESEGAGD